MNNLAVTSNVTLSSIIRHPDCSNPVELRLQFSRVSRPLSECPLYGLEYGRRTQMQLLKGRWLLLRTSIEYKRSAGRPQHGVPVEHCR